MRLLVVRIVAGLTEKRALEKFDKSMDAFLYFQ